MARSAMLQLDPEADGKVTIRFHNQMTSGEVIDSAVVTIQERTSSSPETWEEATGVDATATVVDAYRDDGTTLIAASQAVQVAITDSDQDDDTPARGTNYRVLVIADVVGRDVPLTAKNPLSIRP